MSYYGYYKPVPKHITTDKIICKTQDISNISKNLVENLINNLNAMKEKVGEKMGLEFEISPDKKLTDCSGDTIINDTDYLIHFKEKGKGGDPLFSLAFKYGELDKGGAILQHINEEKLPEGVSIPQLSEQIEEILHYLYTKEEYVTEENPMIKVSQILNINR